MNYEDMTKLVKGKNEFSSIIILPDEIKYEIHVLLDKDFTEENIVKHLKTKYGDSSACPNLEELKEYKKLYRNMRKALNFKDVRSTLRKYLPNFESLLEKVSINAMYSFKEVLLKEMIVKCLARIKRIEKSTTDKVIPSQENVLINYIDQVRTLVDMLVKLESDAKGDKTYLVSMISTELKPLLEAIRATVDEVCPEKSEQFKKVLKEKFNKTIFALGDNKEILNNLSLADSLEEIEVAQKISKDIPESTQDTAIKEITQIVPPEELPYNLQVELNQDTAE